MTNLLKIVDNEPRVSAMTIAENTNNKYESIRELITRNKEYLVKMGTIPTADLKSAVGKQAKIVSMLNEQQVTFLMTTLRNSKQILDFKFALVKEFFLLRENNTLKIKSLNGRIGGLTYSNNMYKNKITLLENQLKNQKLLPPGKTLDEKASDLAKEIDEILTKNPDSFGFMQNRAKYLSRYVQILQSNGTEQQKFMLEEIERYKKQFVEESDKRNQAVWKMERLKNTIDEYVLISNKMLKFRHEE